jgi:hypothetical protein
MTFLSRATGLKMGLWHDVKMLPGLLAGVKPSKYVATLKRNMSPEDFKGYTAVILPKQFRKKLGLKSRDVLSPFRTFKSKVTLIHECARQLLARLSRHQRRSLTTQQWNINAGGIRYYSVFTRIMVSLH